MSNILKQNVDRIYLVTQIFCKRTKINETWGKKEWGRQR